MDFEKYTDKSKALIQSAQEEALKAGHQRFMPEHLLLALLGDRDRLAAKLIRACGGHPDDAAQAVQSALDAMPKVEGSGAGQLYITPETARLFGLAEQAAEKAGDEFITIERLLQALAMNKGSDAAKIPAEAECRHKPPAAGPHGHLRRRRGAVRGAGEIHQGFHRAGEGGKARPGHRSR